MVAVKTMGEMLGETPGLETIVRFRRSTDADIFACDYFAETGRTCVVEQDANGRWRVAVELVDERRARAHFRRMPRFARMQMAGTL